MAGPSEGSVSSHSLVAGFRSLIVSFRRQIARLEKIERDGALD